ncbi:Hypothetical protein, putative [Bodo saltans]|uniref:Uncharacterized protein n=1 Tax=Bodo saltans TaxID=75058 RepID=A0A0S4IIH6_BODSA|nr:Hypothetical protein, putative [Bodo saltans]|eukprot:CUE71901.1 Hypothetical protein, putative [Bodo saltans]
MTNWGTILYVSAQDLAAATTTLTRNTAADATVGNEEAADYNIAVEVIQRALHRLLCGETDMTTSNNANNAMQRQQHIRNNNNATDAKQQTTTTTTIPRQADIFTADDIKNAFLIPYSSTSHMTTPLLAAAASVPPPSSRRLQNKNVLLLVDLGGSEEEVLPVSSDLRAPCLQLRRRRALTAMLKLFPHYIIAGSPLQHEMLMTTATSTSPPITKMVLGHFSNSSGQLLSLIASATASATSSSPLKSKYDFSRPRVPSPPGKAAEPTLFDNAMDADDDDDESACDGFGKSNSESMNSVLEWFCRHPKRFLVAADIVMQRKDNLSSAQRSLQFVPLLLRCMLTTTDGGEPDVTKPFVMSKESTTDEAFKMWGRLCAELLHRQSHVNTSASDDELTTTMLSLAVPQEVLPTRAFRNLFAFSLISLKHSKVNDDITAASAAGSVAQIVVVAPRCVIIGSAAWYHTQCAFEKLSTPSRQQPSSDYHSVTTKLLIETLVVDASTDVSILFHEYLWESIDSIVHHDQQNDSSPSNVKESQEERTLPATTLLQALCSTLCLLPLLTSNTGLFESRWKMASRLGRRSLSLHFCSFFFTSSSVVE